LHLEESKEEENLKKVVATCGRLLWAIAMFGL